MKIQAKLDYACKALLELALHWPKKEPLQLNVIAERQKIPIKFLIQIMISLKQMGLVESIRGKMGGYVLAKPPEYIGVLDVLQAFDKTWQIRAGNLKKKDVLENVWGELQTTINKFFTDITFEVLCQRKRAMDNVAVYTI